MKLVLAFLCCAAFCFLRAASLDGLWTRLALLQAGLVYLVTAIAYHRGWHGVFLKRRDGTLPIAGYVLFWPYIGPQRLMYYVYELLTRESAIDEICVGVFIGRWPRAGQQKFFAEKGIDAILDLTAVFPAVGHVRRARRFLSLPILDAAAPRPDQLVEAVAFLEQSESDRSALLVHCAAGHGRSALVLATFLLETRRAASSSAAIEMIKNARPGIRLNPEQRRALERFAAERGERPGC